MQRLFGGGGKIPKPNTAAFPTDSSDTFMSGASLVTEIFSGLRRACPDGVGGTEPIRLPGRSEKLWLVVAGFGEEPLWLLRNLGRARDSESVRGIVKIPLTRWKIEEAFRFLKQSYNLEDLRVLRCLCIRMRSRHRYSRSFSSTAKSGWPRAAGRLRIRVSATPRTPYGLEHFCWHDAHSLVIVTLLVLLRPVIERLHCLRHLHRGTHPAPDASWFCLQL